MQSKMSIITVDGFHLLFLFNLLFIIKLNSQKEFLRGQTHTLQHILNQLPWRAFTQVMTSINLLWINLQPSILLNLSNVFASYLKGLSKNLLVQLEIVCVPFSILWLNKENTVCPLNIQILQFNIEMHKLAKNHSFNELLLKPLPCLRLFLNVFHLHRLSLFKFVSLLYQSLTEVVIQTYTLYHTVFFQTI